MQEWINAKGILWESFYLTLVEAMTRNRSLMSHADEVWIINNFIFWKLRNNEAAAVVVEHRSMQKKKKLKKLALYSVILTAFNI